MGGRLKNGRRGKERLKKRREPWVRREWEITL